MSIYVEFRRLSIFTMQDYLYKNKNNAILSHISLFLRLKLFRQIVFKIKPRFSKCKKSEPISTEIFGSPLFLLFYF